MNIFYKINVLIKYQYETTKHSNTNIKSSNSRLEKSKSETKNATGVTLRLSMNIVGNDEGNLPHKLL